jgi:hypothetical protein
MERQAAMATEQKDPHYEYTTCHTCKRSVQFIDAGACRCPMSVQHHTICGQCMWLSIDFGACPSVVEFRANVAKHYAAPTEVAT